jgi:hypothetical protein
MLRREISWIIWNLRWRICKGRHTWKLPGVRRILDRSAGRPREHLDLRIGWVQGNLWFRLGGLGVRLVGVSSLADSLEDPRRIPFGKLDLFDDFWLRLTPFASEIEESSSRVECVGSLSKVS